MAQLSLKDKKDLTKQEIYDILMLYIHEKIDLSRRETQKEDNFSMASWSEFQAFHLGMQKAYQKLLDFIPNKKEELNPDQEKSN